MSASPCPAVSARAARRWLVPLLFALALLAPAGAAAEPGYELRERSLRSALVVGASKGFLAVVDTRGHAQVRLTLLRGTATAVYRTTGRVSRRRIEARFGSLGRISVRFRRRRVSRPRPFPPGCRGQRARRETGLFHGSIRFEGENGFTTIDARRAGGEVLRTHRLTCPSPFGRPLLPGRDDAVGGVKLTSLSAVERSGGRRVAFEAVGLPLGPLGDLFFINATVHERRDGMRIARGAFEIGDDSSVLLSPPGRRPVRATVTLPRPFLGSAEYRDAPGRPAEWFGSLAVRLPGAGRVALTGPGFQPALCRVDVAELQSSRCLRRAGVALPRAPVRGAPIAEPARAALRRLAP